MKKALLALLPILLTFAAPPQARAAGSESIALVVNDDAISASDIAARTRLILVSSGLPDTTEIRNKLEPQVISGLIDEHLMLQEATRLGLAITQQDIDGGFATLAQQNNLTPDQFRSIMTQNRIPMRTMEDQIRAQLAWSRIIQEKLRPQIRITDADVDVELDRLKALTGKTQYLLSEIFLPVDAAESESSVRQLADRLAQEIGQRGAPFQKVASQFSQAAGASRGGDMGWMQEGDLPEELDAALAGMAEGTISRPVRTVSGFHILLLRKKNILSADNLPSRDDIMNKLGMEQIDRLQRRYMLDLKAAAFIDRRGA